MRRRLLIAAILLVILTPFVLLGVVLYTPSGLALVAGQLWRLERLGVHITGLSGTLSGPLRVELFELDHPRVHLVVHDIVIHTQLRGLLLQTLQASSVTVRDAVVTMRDAEMPPSTRPPRFLPQFLRVDAGNVELTRVRYEQTNGMVIEGNRAQGRVTITARTLRVRDGRIDGRIDAQQFDASGGLTLRAGKPFGMEANATGHLRMSSGVVLALDGTAKGDFDRLEFAAQLQQPQRAAITAVLTRPDERWNIAGHVDAATFALDPWMQKPPFSLRNVALDVQANPDRIEIAGNLGIPELDSRDLTVEASGNFAKRVLTIASADIALNDSPAKVRAQGTVTLDGESPTLDVAAQWENLQWPLHGAAVVRSATGEGTLRGPMPYDFTTTARVDGPNLPPAQGSAHGVLSKEDLTIAQYDVKAFDGTVTGSGQLQFAQPRAWKLTTRADDINPVELHEEFPGRIDVRAQAEGKGFDKRASFRLALTNLRGTLRNEPVRARATVQRDGKTWQVSDGRLAFGGARVTLDGKLRDTIEAQWSIRAPALDRLLPDAAGSIRIDRLGERRAEVTARDREAARRESSLCRLVGAAARHRRRRRCSRRQSLAPDRGCSTARARQTVDRSAANDRHRPRDGSSHRARRHRLSAATPVGRAARGDGSRRSLRQGSLERDDYHDRVVDGCRQPAAEDSRAGDCAGVARPRAARQLLSGHRRRPDVRRGQVATRRRVAGDCIRLRDSARVGAAAERRGSGDRRAHRRPRACVRHSGPAVARRSRRTHHRRGDHLPPARRGAGDAQSRHRRSRRDCDAATHRVLVRYPGLHRHILICERPAAARRPQRHHESAADRRHARARRGREHPAAGVSRDR